MNTTFALRRVPRSLVACLAAAVLLIAPAAAELTFQHAVIDPTNPANPHCKALGDVDGDGFPDALAASSSGEGLYWYEYPDWAQHEIRAEGFWTTDMQVGDVDGDGDLDVVIPDGCGLKWYENPRPGLNPRTTTWTEHIIGVAGANHHDVEVADMEPDGDLDVISRAKHGSDTSFWRQTAPNTWTRVSVPAGSGEGTALGDLDGDGDLDIAHNGFWMEQQSPTSWVSHTIDSNWASDVGVVIADIDGNGDNDVVLGPSESAGRLSWYSAVDPVAGPWVEHVVDASVTYLHTFKAADVDRDGDLDLVTAEMHQSSDPDEVGIYFNDGDGLAWSQQVVADSGSHNLRVGDIGADGDLDIFGANWNDGAPNSAVIEMWENQTAPLPLGSWRRHIVETSLPWNAVFVDGKDLNGDGKPDLVVGGWWYPNPGALGGYWIRQEIGAPLHNFAAIHDFDSDGDFDILGTNGQVGGEDLSWARNDGSGQFTNFDITNTATGGDFLQGASLHQVIHGGREEVVLSWHNGGSGTAMLAVPDDPTTAAWPLTVLSTTTNQEQVPVGDIDGDGDIDVHLGTSWLRQGPGGTFTVVSGISLSGGGVPDRVSLADLDGDGDLDVVIGVEFGSALVWGENNGSGGGWTEHVIGTDFDYMSVDVGDVDGDGDIDVVGGAHQGSGKVSLYENDGTGMSWTTHVIDAGTSTAIDHHDGTILVDMDLDRDLDVISVGWTQRSLVIYENLAIDDGIPIDLTPPTIVSVGAADGGTVVVDFSEPLNAATANDAANYSIVPGVTVTGASLAVNGQAVVLDVTALAPGVEYTLAVDAVRDQAGNPVAPGTTATFELGAGDPAPGLAAYWPFDEGRGTVTADISGNGNTGVLVNGPSWVGPSWPGGSALDFDGIDDHVDTGTFDLSGSAVTLAAWVWVENLSNCSSRDCRILSKATGTATEDHYFMLSTIASGGDALLRFRLKTDGSTSTLIASSGALPEREWVHVAAVYDGAQMSLYLDGVEVGSAGKTGSLTGNPAVPVWIGGNPTEATGRPFKGMIDEVRIYERALSAAELMALPPPSPRLTFADGFESGDLARWSDRVGSTQVLAAAARIGTRGLRVKAAAVCSNSDYVVIAPPPATLSGTHEACRGLTVGGLQVVAPGATLRAGETVTLGEGFFASADLTVDIDGQLSPFAWVRSTLPRIETAYSVELHLNLDNLVLGASDRIEHLVARSAAGAVTFRLVLEPDGLGGHQAVLEARADNGTFVGTPAGQQVALAAGWHRLRLDWRAGNGSGSLSLAVDGSPAGALTGLTNGNLRVHKVDWGVVGGTLNGTSGYLQLDSFASWN